RHQNPDPIPAAVIGEFPGHSLPILSCAFSPNSTTLVTASADRTLRVWDTSTLRLKANLIGHSEHVQDVTFSPAGRRVVAASWDCTVRVWDAEKWDLVTTIHRHPRPAFSVAFSPNGQHFAVAGGSGEGSVQMFDSRTCHPLWNGPGTGSI